MLYLALAFYKIQLVMPQFMLKFAAFIAIVLSGTDKKDESKTRRSSQEAYVATAELPAEEEEKLQSSAEFIAKKGKSLEDWFINCFDEAWKNSASN